MSIWGKKTAHGALVGFWNILVLGLEIERILSVFEKYLRPDAPVIVVLNDDKERKHGFGGTRIDMDDDALALQAEGPQGRSIIIIMRWEIRAVILSMMGEH